ncbi:ribonuclease H-like domain-containing protein [Burkholderia cenocepacia]
MSKPKILFLDIETAPLLSHTWGTFKQNVGLNQIHTEWSILSFCAKWFGDQRVIYEDTFTQKNKRNDRRIVRLLWNLLNAADIVVAQNGVRFDVKKIQARMILHGHLPPSPFRVVDTMLEARRHFGFTSNKLEWLTDKLCKTHKKQKHAQFPGFELWAEFLSGNPAAAAEMKAYNQDDVLSLEELYLVMRPWMQGHPNVGNYDHDETPGAHKCPACGSHDVNRKGLRHTQVGQYPRYHCKACGHWSRGRLMASTKEQRDNLLIS